MSGSKKKLVAGTAMLAAFVGIMVAIFMPIFDGKNGLDYLDSLYNSISKDSAYYIPELQEATGKYTDKAVQVSLLMKDGPEAERAAKILTTSGAQATAAASEVKLDAKLGVVLKACLGDADRMFANDGKFIVDRYQMKERLVLFTWWKVLKAMTKALNKKQLFDEAKFVTSVNKKAVECSYNYYGIVPQKISERWGIVVFSLIFYVIYTLWFGFGVLFLFEGAGFKLAH